MRIAGRKASALLPRRLQPAARRLGREATGLRHATYETLLRARLAVGMGIRHRHGPARLDLGPENVVALCIVRDGAPWLPTFIRHHRRLGVHHIVFLDNGSQDGSQNLIASHEDVSLFTTSLAFSRYGIPLKRWLVETFGGEGWRLYCDVDELFDYPFSADLPLESFLGYLNASGYTAVTAHTLDMFGKEPLAEVQGQEADDLVTAYPYYDIESVEARTDAYWLRRNVVDHPSIVSYYGGVRGRVFDVPRSKLTKHPLVRPRGGLRAYPYDHHFVTGGRIADVTGLLRHYKFIGTFYEQTRRAIERGQHFNNARKYRRFRAVYSGAPDLRLWSPRARRFERPEDLLEDGFLVASEDYQEFVRRTTASTRSPEPTPL